MQSEETKPNFERVRHALRADGLKPEMPNSLRSGIHTRGYLPHVKREGASYFVTFRLADSLPKNVLMRFQARRAEKLRRRYALLEFQKKSPVNPCPIESEEAIDRDYYRQIERYLDTGIGACYLRRPEIADLVAKAFQYHEGKWYLLSDWVVMPNHAHAVVWPMPNVLLSDILKSWKGYTARAANKILNRSGDRFWQQEPFDHWIRDDEEKARICRYIRHNPVHARLFKTPEEWRWSSAWPGERKVSA